MQIQWSAKTLCFTLRSNALALPTSQLSCQLVQMKCNVSERLKLPWRGAIEVRDRHRLRRSSTEIASRWYSGLCQLQKFTSSLLRYINRKSTSFPLHVSSPLHWFNFAKRISGSEMHSFFSDCLHIHLHIRGLVFTLPVNAKYEISLRLLWRVTDVRITSLKK